MSDLNQRLVDDASDAFDVGTFNFDAVVAAIARELAIECDSIDGAAIPAVMLWALADPTAFEVCHE